MKVLLLLTILGALAGLSLGQICQEGFIHFYPDPTIPMPTCIKFAMDQKRTWHEAVDYCDSLNSDLARLDDGQLHFELIDYIKSRDNMKHEGFHIGCSDEYEEEYWVWLDGSPVELGPPHWGPHQPDGGRRENYGCLYTPDFLFNSCVNGQTMYAICRV